MGRIRAVRAGRVNADKRLKSAGTLPRRRRFPTDIPVGGKIMKGIIAWLLGVPVIVIILLYVTGIF